MPKILVASLMMVFSLFALAKDDVRNSSDHSQLQRFPQSYIVQYKQGDISDYRLVLGGLEKVNGLLVAEKEERLSGNLTNITYRIPESHSAEEALEFLQSQLIAKNAQILFECTGRACGSSNQWANNIFGYSRLYGVDTTQHYIVNRLGDAYFVIYVVKRGNKRVYARLDILQLESVAGITEDKKAFVLSIGENGKVELLDFLQSNPLKRVWLVAYNFTASDKKAQLDNAKSRLKELEMYLLANSISAERFGLHAAGSFVPPPYEYEKDSVIVYSEDK